jgi:hypothetical protein
VGLGAEKGKGRKEKGKEKEKEKEIGKEENEESINRETQRLERLLLPPGRRESTVRAKDEAEPIPSWMSKSRSGLSSCKRWDQK